MGVLLEALKGITIPEAAKPLVSEADGLLTQRAERAQYVQYLETEIENLRKEKGIPGVVGNLVFDDKTGTYADPEGRIRYCTKCLSDGKRTPLKNETRGWRCMVCTKYFSDPARDYE